MCPGGQVCLLNKLSTQMLQFQATNKISMKGQEVTLISGMQYIRTRKLLGILKVSAAALKGRDSLNFELKEETSCLN